MFDLYSLDPRLLFPQIPDMYATILDFVLFFVSVFTFILVIIADWKLFKKFGEKPWKSLIPYYNMYIRYKYTWNTRAFWFYFITLSCFELMLTMSEFAAKRMPESVIVSVLLLAAVPFGILAAVKSIQSCMRMSESFGKSLGFTVGLVFLNSIFTMILGFGKAEYVGPLSLPDENDSSDGSAAESVPESEEPAAATDASESGKETV